MLAGGCVCLSLKEKAVTAAVDWCGLKTAANTVFVSQNKCMLSVCALSPWSQTGQHSADVTISQRTKKCIHTKRPQTFTVALALV